MAFLDVHIKEKEYLSLLYTMYIDASNNNSSLNSR